MPAAEKSSNRAEAVRQRRANRSRKPLPTSREHAARAPKTGVRKPGTRKSGAAAPPPVLSRGGLGGMVNQGRKKNKQVKRRYDIALGASGAEMRLPALPSVRIGWRLASGLLVAALIYLLYSVWNAPTYRVLAAEVQGLERLSVQDINAVAGVAGDPIMTVVPEKIREELQVAFPELSSVSVEVSLPSKVLVTVEERQPVLAWVQEGQTVWVDESGVAFPPRGDSGPGVLVQAPHSPPGSPQEADSLEDGSSSHLLSPELVVAILAMAEQAPENTPLVYSREHGLGWEDERGWEVYFGDEVGDMKMKLGVYKAIVKRLNKEDIQPAFISVEYVHAPYFRLEQ